MSIINEKRADVSEYQLAAAVARYVELRDVRLQSLRATGNLLTPPPPEVTLASGPKRVAYEFDEDVKVLRVLASMRADLSVTGAKQPMVTVEADYVIEYFFKVEGGPEGNERHRHFSAFAEVNGVFNLWPYFRELVQNVSGRMGGPLILLPVYRVVLDKKDASESTDPVKPKRLAGVNR